MTLYDLPAPAKLNLFLHVVGQRPDGYHLLQTAFRFIDWCDTLSFERRDDGVIACDTLIEGVAAADNLIVRAARLLQQATGTRYGVQIACDKHIPAGGGLGGGSSNAATTLIALNRLWNTGLGRHELMLLGLSLGADVPVFIFGESAFAEGVGEELTPLLLPDSAYLVAELTQKISTQAVFQSTDLTRNTPCITISIFTDWLAAQLATAGFGSSRAQFGHNDLQPVVCTRYPEVAQALAWLQQNGAHFRMSGSGSSLFAEFATVGQAGVYKQAIAGKIAALPVAQQAVIRQLRVCSGLPHHPLRYWLNH